jgi:hypothetical protein
LTLKALHGVISQNIVLFITTAVRTSNPHESYCLLGCDAMLSVPVFKADPEYRGCGFNQNVDSYRPDYMASHPRRHYLQILVLSVSFSDMGRINPLPVNMEFYFTMVLTTFTLTINGQM